MNQFQGIDLLLELDVVGRECSLGTCQHGGLGQLDSPATIAGVATHLIVCLSQLFLEVLRTSLGKG